MTTAVLDVRRAAGNFSRAATRYDAAAALQAETRSALLQRLPADPAVRRLLDLGCGTGLALPLLQARYPTAECVALDRAEGMLRCAGGRGPAQRLLADAQALPLAAGSCDRVFSNLMLQWCPQPQRVLHEAARVLRPGGVFALCLPAPGTLEDLRRAWRAVDAAEHVHRFDAALALPAQARAAGFAVVEEVRAEHRQRFDAVRSLMQSLRAIGAANASAGRRRSLLGPQALRRLEAAYPRAPHPEEGIVAIWDILYLVLRR